jgi:PAS domain S-box-containing protein
MDEIENKSFALEREKFKSLMEGVKEAVVLLDPEQKIIYTNEKTSALTGYTSREMLSKHVSEVLYMIDADDKLVDPNLICPIGGIDMDGVIYRSEHVSLVDKKDMVKAVNIQSRKIHEGSKIGLGAMIIIDDVFQKDELERMKIDFVSMAVHMLRTPLTVIKGFLSTLMKLETVQKLNRDELDSITSAIAGADELDMLVENLLHLSEIQTGKFKIITSNVAYDGLVATIVSEFKANAEAKDLRILFVPPLYDLPMVKLDLARIKEVLRNLIDNAIKYTDKGGVEISLSREGDFIKTTIKDSGRGIPPSNLEYIFTKFYRIKDPLEMKSGLGLGLFVARRVIEAHGGKIWAESVEGQGSNFHFTLPVSTVPVR